MVHLAAERYGINEIKFTKTLECESANLTHNGQSYVVAIDGPNGREDSWGIAQIHLPSHPEITRDQALDPAFALDFAARRFAQGHASDWTCYRILYG